MESKLINLNNNNKNTNLFFSYPDSFSSRDSDIEMISVDSLSSYTSLKDILRATSPPSPVDSLMKFKRIDSWREIPIKDPLLQHAAWAYLQPMSSEPDSGHRCCFWKLKDCFCGFFAPR
ncbi:hypothetical protein L1987_32209 [Smallanthus sonchifolius]|uniref:Uncharacterized protein n=1 Tax=Smallanthus sonchifolius TaxID=185202 RepID=A0ACB9I985_9ASTR|nr:hypothetical protein L1987_32209 [Smallanthus sonchifolius]